VLLPKIKKIPKNTNGRLAIPAPAGLLVLFHTQSNTKKCQINKITTLWRATTRAITHYSKWPPRKKKETDTQIT